MTRMNRKSTAFTLIELLIVIAIIAILALIAIPNFIEAQTRSKVARVQSDMRTVATALESYYVDYNAYPRLQNNPVGENAHSTYQWFIWSECNPDYWGKNLRAFMLTTPIAYLSGRPPVDPFAEGALDDSDGDLCRLWSYYYYNFLGAARARTIYGQLNGYPGEHAPAVAPAPMRFDNGGARDDPGWENATVRYTMWALMSVGPDRQRVANQPTYNFLASEAAWDNMVQGRTTTYDPTNGTISEGCIWRLQVPPS